MIVGTDTLGEPAVGAGGVADVLVEGVASRQRQLQTVAGQGIAQRQRRAATGIGVGHLLQLAEPVVVAHIEQQRPAAIQEHVGREGDGLPPPFQVGHVGVQEVVLVAVESWGDGLAVIILQVSLSDEI